MSILGFLLLLLIAAVAGVLGQWLGGYSLGGLLISTLVGFVGAAIGVWIAGQFNLPSVFVVQVEGQAFPVFWAIIGSALLSAVVGLLMRRG
jgi:uncharacterized membrane protein YeaQ/YmgE (transglycosylase-associated protein family)